jgi:dTDP-4-dehydrorhamnose reductase
MVWLIGYKGLLGAEVYNVLTNNKIQFFYSDSELDITDANLVKQVVQKEKIDWIINCACYSNIEQAESEKEKAMSVNGHAIQTLVDIAKEKNATIIHISCESVFDGKKYDGYVEEDETNPINYYGYSKLAGEQVLIQNYNKYFILRTSWLYGKNGINFVYTMLKLFGSGATVSVVDDQTGSPTYALDIAKIIGYLITIKADKYGIYHCSNTGRTDWFEFANTILDKSIQHNILPNWIKTKTKKIIPISSNQHISEAKKPQHSYLDSNKMKNTYKINMRSWKDALDAFFKSIQKTKDKVNG